MSSGNALKYHILLLLTSDTFSPILEKEMRKTNSGPGQIVVIGEQVEEVKEIMKKNIEEVLER